MDDNPALTADEVAEWGDARLWEAARNIQLRWRFGWWVRANGAQARTSNRFGWACAPIRRDNTPDELSRLADRIHDLRKLISDREIVLEHATRAMRRKDYPGGGRPDPAWHPCWLEIDWIHLLRQRERRAVKRAEKVAAQLEEALERIERRPSATGELLEA